MDSRFATISLFAMVLAMPCVAKCDEADLARAISQLGSDKFAERQEASRILREAGPEAIPQIAAALQSGDAEVRMRAFAVLSEHALSSEAPRSRPARLALAELAAGPPGRVATSAAAALEAVEQLLIARLTAMRAVVGSRRATGIPLAARGEAGDDAAVPSIASLLKANRWYQIQINQGWNGGEEGLALLAELGGIGWLSAESAPITDDSLVHFGRLTNLEQLYLGSSRVQGSGLKNLAPLVNLKYLSLKQLPLDDDDLAGLPAFPELQSLGLDLTEIGDAGLVHLARYPRVNRLWLDGTRITDAGLTQLKSLPELNTLYLAGTKVTGPGLAELQGHAGLTYLSLKHTKFQANGLVHLGQLKQLERLGLDDTNVTDEMLAGLSGLTKLRELWLNSTPITDAGLVHLRGLKDLQVLHLDSTEVTSDGVIDLQRAIPNLSVTR